MTAQSPKPAWLTALPEDIPQDTLRAVLEFYDENLVLRTLEEHSTTLRYLSPDEVARALSGQVSVVSGLLPPGTLWWKSDATGSTTAVWREPQPWKTALLRTPFEPPQSFRLPMPGLIFTCKTGQPPRVYAATQRPTNRDQPLFHIPTFNVFADGRICPGTHSFPPDPNEVPESFFDSFFSLTGDTQQPFQGAQRRYHHPLGGDRWKTPISRPGSGRIYYARQGDGQGLTTPQPPPAREPRPPPSISQGQPREPVGYLINRADGLTGSQGTGYDYVWASNGLFVQSKNGLMAARTKLTDQETKGLLPTQEKLDLVHGLIPGQLLREGLEWTDQEPDRERYFAIVWLNRRYRLILPEQDGTPGSVTYHTPDLPTIAEYHSHGPHAPFFSETDNRDEQGIPHIRRDHPTAGPPPEDPPETRHIRPPPDHIAGGHIHPPGGDTELTHILQPPHTSCLNVVIVGCGGTGSFLAESICRLLTGTTHQLHLVDPDTVETRNTLRQNFYPAEIGVNKAEALARRLARNFAVPISYSQRRLTTDCHSKTWFETPERDTPCPLPSGIQILIACVDNAAARLAVDNHTSNQHNSWTNRRRKRRQVRPDTGRQLQPPPAHNGFLQRRGLPAATDAQPAEARPGPAQRTPPQPRPRLRPGDRTPRTEPNHQPDDGDTGRRHSSEDPHPDLQIHVALHRPRDQHHDHRTRRPPGDRTGPPGQRPPSGRRPPRRGSLTSTNELQQTSDQHTSETDSDTGSNPEKTGNAIDQDTPTDSQPDDTPQETGQPATAPEEDESPPPPEPDFRIIVTVHGDTTLAGFQSKGNGPSYRDD